MAIHVQEAASLRLDEIYRYTRDKWGTEQAKRYIVDLFAAFDQIESHGVLSRPIPAEFGVGDQVAEVSGQGTVVLERRVLGAGQGFVEDDLRRNAA